MADCGKFEYQLIEQVGSRALSTAQLLRAEINSIDHEANTADITLLDECDTMLGMDLSAVKFWYHCEFSTGTIEDLAHGHLAFKPEDIVYLVFNPAIRETSSILYIVGHVDIRDTKKCQPPHDYVLISLGYDTSLGDIDLPPHGYMVTMFSTETGAVLDLETFEQLEGSPAAPASLPCVKDSAFADWLSYNFETQTPAHNCPMKIMNHDLSRAVSELITDDDSDCEYHSKTGYNNGYYRETFCSVEWSEPDTYNRYYKRVSIERDYYLHAPTSTETANGGWKIVDTIAGETHFVVIGGDLHFSGSGEATSYSGIVSALVDVEFSILSNSTMQSDATTLKEYTASSAYGLGFTVIHRPSIIASGIRGNGYAIGNDGLYCLFNFNDEYVSTYQFVTNPETGGVVGEPCVNSGIEQGIFIIFPSDGHITSSSSRSYFHSYGLGVGYVCLFDEVPGEKEYLLSPTRCMRNANQIKSKGLEDTFSELKKAVYDLTNTMNVKGVWAWSSPGLNVYFKRMNPPDA